MSTRIIDVPASQQFEENTIEYMIEVNRKRQVPSTKDGLKPVQRRIIDTMTRHLSCLNTRVKSASITGRTLECSHPHGDTAVYDAMKPLTNWFEKLYPLIDGQGNFGSPYGDGAAAARYTESRLSQFAKDALSLVDVKNFENITDWLPTYDGKNIEPEYFPAALPILLIEGSFGIGMGLKVELPPHNLIEVIDATLTLLRNPDANVTLIPDQCMPCYIFDTDFSLISNKGHGSVTFRGIVDIEKRKNHDVLVIKSSPDMVYIETVKEKIEELAEQKQIQLQDWYEEDAYTADGHKYSWYVVELKKGADPYYTRDIIYKKTELEHSVSISFESLDDDYRPVRYSYKAYLQTFIANRMLTKFRVVYSKLQAALTRQHQIDAFIKALLSGQIDNIINAIRSSTSKTDDELIEYLITLLNITDLQAKFIAEVNLKKLKPIYLQEYQQEFQKLQADIDKYMTVIESDELILQDIEQELIQFKQKYGKPRNTIVIDAQKDTVPKGEFKLIITQNNFIKKLPLNMNGVGNLKGDKIKTIIKVDNTKDILLFDEIGKVYRLPVNKIPVSDKSSNGVDVRLLCKNLTSNIVTVLYGPKVQELAQSVEPYYLTAITANGNIKKLELQDLISVPLSGIIFFKIDSDAIRDVKIVHDKLDIVVYSAGEALRIPMSDVPLQKRNTKGVKSMNNTSVIDGFCVVTPDTTNVIVITNSGKINKLNIAALPLSERNKKSTRIIKLNKGDSIFSVHMCNDHNILHINTTGDKFDIPVNEIPDGSSISTGKSLISLKSDILIRTSIR